MLKKLLGLLSDAAVYGASNAISQLIGFFLLPLYTAYLSPADYGVVAMLTIVSLLFGPVANLGMTNAIFRRFNLDKDEAERQRVLSTGLASVVVSSLVLLAAGAAAARPIAELVVGNESQRLALLVSGVADTTPGAILSISAGAAAAGSVAELTAAGTDFTGLVRLTLLSATLLSIGNVPLVILRARRRVKTMASINIARLVVSVGVTIWLVVVERLGVLGVVLGTLAADGLFLFVQLALVAQYVRRLANIDTWRRMASYGLPFVPHHVQAVGLALFGQYMTGRMLGLDEAGIYNVAVKFAIPVGFIVNAVQSAWTAYKFQIHADDEDPAGFFRSAFTYYVAGIAWLWLGVTLWGPELVRVMTDESFHAAAVLVSAAALIPVSHGLYFMIGTGMELSDNTRPYPLVSLAGLAVVIAGALLLIPRMGALGAALATAAGWTAMAAVVYWLAQRRFQVVYDWPAVASLALLAAAGAAAGRATQELPLVPRIAVAAGVSLAFPLAAAVVLWRSPTERGRMHILWSRLVARRSTRTA